MYQITVFGRGSAEARRRKLFRAASYIKREYKGARYIFFCEENEVCCGNILMSEKPDMFKLKRAGYRTGITEVREESLPGFLNYMERRAKGKYFADRRTKLITKLLRFRYRNSPHPYQSERQRPQEEEKKSLPQGLLWDKALCSIFFH